MRSYLYLYLCICVFVFVFGGRFEIKQLEVKKATGVHHLSIFGVLLFAICYFLQILGILLSADGAAFLCFLQPWNLMIVPVMMRNMDVNSGE